MKRVSFNRFTSKNIAVALPEDFEREKIEIYLMCDSYIGLDQYHLADLSLINEHIAKKSGRSLSDIRAFKVYSELKKEVIEDVQSDGEMANDGSSGVLERIK